MAALIMSNNPNGPYRFASDVEWDQQYFDNGWCKRRRNRVIPLRVR